MPIKKNDLLKETGFFLKFDVEVDHEAKRNFTCIFRRWHPYTSWQTYFPFQELKLFPFF